MLAEKAPELKVIIQMGEIDSKTLEVAKQHVFL